MEWITNLFTFRNGNHLFYFLMTFPVFVLYNIVFYSSSNKSGFLYSLPLMIIIYAAVAVRAVQVVLIHKTESEVFSIDCIWYNSLLTVGYLVMLVVYLLKR